MKNSFITFISLFFFLICAVTAAPTTPDSTEIAKRDFEELDVILSQTKASVFEKNAIYNSTSPTTTTHVVSYCNEISAIIQVAINKCGLIPPGHIFANITIIAHLLLEILCDINYTLLRLVTNCGLLGLIAAILLLVGTLIVKLNLLLVIVGGLCGPGLLALLLSLLVGCGPDLLLFLLGLVIII